MKIGIDVSQVVYSNTGVSNYLAKLVENLLKADSENEYVLFFSSLRRDLDLSIFKVQESPRVTIKTFKFPPILLDYVWNRLHIMPIEWLIGDVDIFITSDWTEPPTKKSKKATIIYDLIVYKYPEETHSKTEFSPLKLLISPNIVASQKRKLTWVKKESDIIFTISQSSKKDIEEILKIESNKIKVIYPAIHPIK